MAREQRRKDRTTAEKAEQERQKLAEAKQRATDTWTAVQQRAAAEKRVTEEWVAMQQQSVKLSSDVLRMSEEWAAVRQVIKARVEHSTDDELKAMHLRHECALAEQKLAEEQAALQLKHQCAMAQQQ
eukprot:242690-Rhodomonas_salina.1